MSVVRSSFGLENFHIFYLELRKHLQYAAIHSNSTTKLKRISETNNTLAGHCSSGGEDRWPHLASKTPRFVVWHNFGKLKWNTYKFPQ